MATLITASIALFWILLLWWVRTRSRALAAALSKQARESGKVMIIQPQACLYRGSDARFGNVKGNGVICLTSQSLLFEKLTGQRIEIDRLQIRKTEVQDSFKGKTSLATGGKHLVITTADGNRIGFLLNNPETWTTELNRV